MKNVANAITAARMLLCIVLVFLYGSPAAFFAVYLVCAATDVLDGYIARRTHTQSSVGARLDSVADVMLFTVNFVGWLYWAGDAIMRFMLLAAVVILLRLVSVVVGAVRFHALILVHTLLNKAAGALVIIALPFYLVVRDVLLLWPVCILALLSALEEMIILISAKQKPDLNTKGLFAKHTGT